MRNDKHNRIFHVQNLNFRKEIPPQTNFLLSLFVYCHFISFSLTFFEIENHKKIYTNTSKQPSHCLPTSHFFGFSFSFVLFCHSFCRWKNLYFVHKMHFIIQHSEFVGCVRFVQIKFIAICVLLFSRKCLT